jgi:hypothetical protein
MNTATLHQKRELLKVAQATARKLGTFRTPNTNAPVDPSHVAVILRFLRTHPPMDFVDKYLAQLPTSHVARYTGSAGPQLQETCVRAKEALREVRKLVRGEEDQVTAFAYVLGWSARLMRTQERTGAPTQGRGPEPRGQPRMGPHRR